VRSTHRVVIVGSGFGGLFAARILRFAPVSVTIVDRTNHHLFQPLLYQVATGILSEGEIAPAIRDVVRRFANTAVEMADVTTLDLTGRAVHARRLVDGAPLVFPYDSLVVATGIGTSYFGHDEFSQWAPGMKTIDDALELRGRIFGAFEVAESLRAPADRAEWLTFAVVGGGPTGVEMAGQIAELSRRSLRRNFRAADPASARVLLFEGGDEILAPFGHRLARRAAADLGRLGVEIHTGAMVVGMDERSVTVRTADGAEQAFPTRTKVWAAGMRASPLAAQLAAATGAELDPMGRIKVLDDCSLPGHPEVFAVGDMMALGGLPGMAEVAIQSGIHAGRLIKHRAETGSGDGPLRYRDLGSVAVISRFGAVAKLGRVRLGGFPAWLVWLVVHLTFLTGFKNRFGALARWAFSFVGTARSERTITHQQIVARQALEGRGPLTPPDRRPRDGAPRSS
jgi:NADH:ubiquinone reductase (H+-translocating)